MTKLSFLVKKITDKVVREILNENSNKRKLKNFLREAVDKDMLQRAEEVAEEITLKYRGKFHDDYLGTLTGCQVSYDKVIFHFVRYTKKDVYLNKIFYDMNIDAIATNIEVKKVKYPMSDEVEKLVYGAIKRINPKSKYATYEISQ